MDDPLFVKLMENLTVVLNVPTTQFVPAGSIINLLPISCLPGIQTSIKINKAFTEILSGFIKEHQETFDPTFLRDYIDVYLDEMKNREHEAENTFTVDRLIANTIDLFIAGTETTSNALQWALRILMFRPDVQQKIHSEIDEVVGRERLPATKDRPKMPYTEAAINEIMRYSSLTPLGVFHRNEEEVKFRNYTIPKDSCIIQNLMSVHFDPKYWTEPDKFEPTRFLNEKGQFVKNEAFHPFSVGKRVCLGESLARMEIFIFLISILQRFSIVPPDGVTDTPLESYYGGLIRSIKSYKLCVRQRY